MKEQIEDKPHSSERQTAKTSQKPTLAIDSTTRFQRAIAWGGIALLALAVGVYFARALTPWGPWGFTDSAVYITEAWNWAHGVGPIVWDGSSSPRWVTMFAPGYPALLALGLHWTSDWVAVAREWNVALVIIWVLISAIPALRWVEPPWAIWGIASLFLLQPLAKAFSSMMSEPPFLVAEALLIWSLVHVLEAQNEKDIRKRLVKTTFLASVATFIRWAGMWSVLLLAWVAWQAPASSLRKRLEHLLWSIAGPPAVWLLWLLVAQRHGARTTRTPATTLASLWKGACSYITSLGHLGLGWVNISSTMQVAGVWGGVLLVTVILAYTWKHARLSLGGRWTWMWAAAALAWVPFLGFAHMSARPAPSIDARMFTPALAALSMAGLGVLWLGIKRLHPHSLRALLALGFLGALWPLWQHSASVDFLATLRAQGLGYTHHVWHEMAQQGVVHAARQIPQSVTLISNDPEGLMLWLHRPVLPMTEVIYTLPRTQIMPYGTRTDDPRQKKFRQNGALVLIAFSRQRLHLTISFYEAMHQWSKGLYVCYRGPDGGVFLPHPQPKWCTKQ